MSNKIGERPVGLSPAVMLGNAALVLPEVLARVLANRFDTALTADVCAATADSDLDWFAHRPKRSVHHRTRSLPQGDLLFIDRKQADTFHVVGN